MNLTDQCLAEGLEDFLTYAGDTAYVSMASGTKRRLVVSFEEPTGINGLVLTATNKMYSQIAGTFTSIGKALGNTSPKPSCP